MKDEMARKQSLVSRYIRVWSDETRYLVSVAGSFIALVARASIARTRYVSR